MCDEFLDRLEHEIREKDCDVIGQRLRQLRASESSSVCVCMRKLSNITISKIVMLSSVAVRNFLLMVPNACAEKIAKGKRNLSRSKICYITIKQRKHRNGKFVFAFI